MQGTCCFVCVIVSVATKYVLFWIRGTWASRLESRIGNDKFSEDSAKVFRGQRTFILPFQLFKAEQDAAPEKNASTESNAAPGKHAAEVI